MVPGAVPQVAHWFSISSRPPSEFPGFGFEASLFTPCSSLPALRFLLPTFLLSLSTLYSLLPAFCFLPSILCFLLPALYFFLHSAFHSHTLLFAFTLCFLLSHPATFFLPCYFLQSNSNSQPSTPSLPSSVFSSRSRSFLKAHPQLPGQFLKNRRCELR